MLTTRKAPVSPQMRITLLSSVDLTYEVRSYERMGKGNVAKPKIHKIVRTVQQGIGDNVVLIGGVYKGKARQEIRQLLRSPQLLSR